MTWTNEDTVGRESLESIQLLKEDQQAVARSSNVKEGVFLEVDFTGIGQHMLILHRLADFQCQQKDLTNFLSVIACKKGTEPETMFCVAPTALDAT